MTMCAGMKYVTVADLNEPGAILTAAVAIQPQYAATRWRWGGHGKGNLGKIPDVSDIMDAIRGLMAEGGMSGGLRIDTINGVKRLSVDPKLSPSTLPQPPREQ